MLVVVVSVRAVVVVVVMAVAMDVAKVLALKQCQQRWRCCRMAVVEKVVVAEEVAIVITVNLSRLSYEVVIVIVVVVVVVVEVVVVVVEVVVMKLTEKLICSQR